MLASAIGLAGCGGSGDAPAGSTANTVPAHATSEVRAAPPAAAAVVAHVGPYRIDGAALDRRLATAQSEAPASERLDPPRFEACIAHLRAEAALTGERAPAAPQLRGECETRYRELLQSALDRLIVDDWLIGGARELGVSVSERAAQQGAGLDARARAATVAAIRQAVEARVAPPSHAQIASYYAAHRFQYLTAAAARAVEIARTKTEAAAARVRAEVESGKSFASLVGGLEVQQPFDSRDGLALEVHPHTYGEPALNEAIFTTAPGVLSGPVDTWFGWFVFRVTKVELERERPLAAVESSIRRRLEREPRKRALDAFVKSWKATWKARTDCDAQYVVPDCAKFSGSPSGLAEEPTPLG